MSEPAGLRKLNRTPSQIDGNESAHNPSVPDAANGRLTDADTEIQSNVLFAPLPGDVWASKKQTILKQMSDAKRKLKA